jgi:peptidoglycan/xylan/chitin deacetylase (PgdA/CDA1 family)
LLPALACGACHYDVGSADSAYYNWDDRKVHCAIDIDTYADISTGSIDTGLDRVLASGEVLELYTHDPTKTVTWDAIQAVLAGVQSRGLAFVTFDDILAGNRPATGGLALSFDDDYVQDWLVGRPMFQQYGARLTFWIAFYNTMSPSDKAGVQQLAADGHAVEAHTVKHQRAPEYVEEYGLDAWMNNEVQPSIDELRDDGYTIDAFAYPYGSRTDETDQAVLDRVKLVRSVSYTWDSPATDPCPY